jgi:CrcB protein
MARTRGRAERRDDARALAAVAVGGALGATARYAVDVATDRWGIALPWATLAVNVLGCALMGLLVAYVLAHPARHLLWRPFLGVGVLGGFTTFSAFAADAVLLADQGAGATSAAYVVATLAGGLLALWGGTSLGRSLRRRRPVT